ncbi:DUF3169 family protein [Alkalihalobacillus sp. MEB130]|uniref:DUF3169 family protein n=1 Tax=Alkalihalobacillus sp. MEB130 TaxID=2976704 RepID=UPI0028DE6555|nr:DUF3169 family protein [Alkalihalobacillus sp. MEB130]MDT8860377.1 DUF3169 family protein [Alkalihalobacillus sp. MEB130]
MKNSRGKMIIITIGAAVGGFFTAFLALFLSDQNLVLDSQRLMQGVLYGSIMMYFLFMLLFFFTRKQLKTANEIWDEDEKEDYVMRKVTNLIGYSSFMQLASILIFALVLINMIDSDGFGFLLYLAGAWVLLWLSGQFIKTGYKENNTYLPDLKYFYKKNESITSYVSRLDEAQKFQVYKYCFSIVEKMKILFLAAFGIAVFVTLIFELSPHLVLGIMTLWFIFQYITIRESKRVRV